jgi:DNA-directed RNA polymerase III subunit RPC5
MPPRKAKATLPPVQDESLEQDMMPIDIPDIDSDLISSDEEFNDDDDPVVKSYDVFISDHLKDQIYLLQYPIRNVEEQYEGVSSPFNARIKPNEGSLEMEVPIDSTNFSIPRSERFGGQIDSTAKREMKTFDRQRLTGKSRANQANYFVALVLGGLNH